MNEKILQKQNSQQFRIKINKHFSTRTCIVSLIQEEEEESFFEYVKFLLFFFVYLPSLNTAASNGYIIPLQVIFENNIP